MHTPEQRERYLKKIDKILTMDRPQKWVEAKKLTLEINPQLKQEEKEFTEACKELRLKNQDKFAASESGTMRNTMKIYGPVLTSLMKLDPELRVEWSGKNKGDQEKIGKLLYEAFPEYRIARMY